MWLRAYNKSITRKKRFDGGLYLEEYIIHFNIKIHKIKYNKMIRENYCEPTNKISIDNSKFLLLRIKNFNYEKFNKYLLSFVNKNKFKEVRDLNLVNGVIGVYIMVSDEYKQVYIGISNDVKRRILQHWSKKKEFDKLLNGYVEDSVLSIDSFGALDTTRIYIKPLKHQYNLDKLEEKYVFKFKNIYTLNRVNGGLNSKKYDLIRNQKLLLTIKKRILK